MTIIKHKRKLGNIEDWKKEVIKAARDIDERKDMPLLFLTLWSLYQSDFVWEEDTEKWLADRFQSGLKSSFSGNLELAFFYFSKEKLDPAIVHLTMCVKLRPQEFYLYYFLGVCHIGKGNIDSDKGVENGLTCFEEGLTFCPKEFKHIFYFFIGKTLLGEGNIDKAIANLRIAREAFQDGHALSLDLTLFKINSHMVKGQYYSAIGLSFWRDGNLSKAKEEFLKSANEFKKVEQTVRLGGHKPAMYLLRLIDFEISYQNNIRNATYFDELERNIEKTNEQFLRYYYEIKWNNKLKGWAQQTQSAIIRDIISFASGKRTDSVTNPIVFEFSPYECLFFAKWFYYQKLIIFFTSQEIVDLKNIHDLKVVLGKFGFIREQHTIDSIDDFLKGLQAEVAQYKSISNIPKDRQVILLDRLKNCFEFATKPTFLEPSKVPPDKESKHVKELLESIDDKTSIIVETVKDASLIDDLPPWLKIPYKVFKKILKIKTKNERLFWEVLIALILLAIFLIEYFPHLISLKKMFFNLIKSLAKRLQITL